GAERYRAEIREISPTVNAVAPHVPRRRLRKLHIGLFGYSRDDERDEVSLPRAITFCASLYAIGIAPEALGLAGVSDDDWAYLCDVVPDLSQQIADGVRFSDPKFDADLPPLVRESVRLACARCESDVDEEHARLAGRVRAALREGDARMV